jgi:hypothetical protein
MRKSDGLRGRRHLARFPSKIENPLQSGQIVLKRGGAGDQCGEGIQEQGEIEEEHHQVPERQVPLQNLVSTIHEQEGGASGMSHSHTSSIARAHHQTNNCWRIKRSLART